MCITNTVIKTQKQISKLKLKKKIDQIVKKSVISTSNSMVIGELFGTNSPEVN